MLMDRVRAAPRVSKGTAQPSRGRKGALECPKTKKAGHLPGLSHGGGASFTVQRVKHASDAPVRESEAGATPWLQSDGCAHGSHQILARSLRECARARSRCRSAAGSLSLPSET